MKHLKKVGCGIFALAALASVNTLVLTACSKNPYNDYIVGQDISFNNKKQASNAKQFAINHIFVASPGISSITKDGLYSFLTIQNDQPSVDYAGSQIYCEILYHMADTYKKNCNNQIKGFVDDKTHFQFKLNDASKTITNTGSLLINYNSSTISIPNDGTNEYNFEYVWDDTSGCFAFKISEGTPEQTILQFESYALKGVTLKN